MNQPPGTGRTRVFGAQGERTHFSAAGRVPGHHY